VLHDGLKQLGRDNEVAVRDIAELVADALICKVVDGHQYTSRASGS